MNRKRIPAARRQQILNWLRKEGSLSIRELESRLDVSHMTIHRDLKTLSAKDLIRKVRGGAVLIADQSEARQDHRSCLMCGGRVTRRQEFIILPKEKEQITACCPHCGIMLVIDIGQVDSALARDYLYGRMINVYQAYYVIASDILLCCEPTVLCFARMSDADKFCRGFGGQVMDFSQALTHLTASHHHVHG
jgi:DeoR/GlpR family transcriptional regulator of sugar metabolism